jgi:hypothetical protein
MRNGKQSSIEVGVGRIAKSDRETERFGKENP